MTTRTCVINECKRTHYARGWCVTHYRRWQRHGDARADSAVVKRSRDGEGYPVVMRRLRRERGSATARACADCGGAAACWSYDGHDPDARVHPQRGLEYSLDITRYRPRCRFCHRRAIAARHRTAASLELTGQRAFDVERAATLYRAGASCHGIGSLMGLSADATRRALRAHGVQMRPSGRRKTH
jgi:hypothetical protein